MELTKKTYELNADGSVFCDGSPLWLCLEIANHSPTGFAWGYEGSGPAQLALAIMVKEFGRDLNKHPIHYQDLKRDFIARLEQSDYHTFTTLDVISCINDIRDLSTAE